MKKIAEKQLELIYHEVWIKDQKKWSKKEIPIPPDKDGSQRSKMRVKDYVCGQGFFSWDDYTKIRVKKMQVVY